MGAADGEQFRALHAVVILRPARSRRDDRRASARRQRGAAESPAMHPGPARDRQDGSLLRPNSRRDETKKEQIAFFVLKQRLDCSCNFGTKRVQISQRHRLLASLTTKGCYIMAQNVLRLIEEKTVDKSKALDAALAQIERAFGKGSIMRLGANEQVVEIETVSTGSLGLDIALGIGGLPRGRIVEIYGPESSGKTTLALHTVAEAQKKGGICAFVDAEHALDPVYARKLGVDLDDLLISQPDTGEQALEIADTLVRSGAIDVLVIDSVAALTPRAEIEGEMGDSLPGLQARLMSQALRKLTASISRSNTHGHLHQPDPHEDRRDVRLARDHDRRQCAEVLCLGPPRHPPHRRDQGPRRGGRQPDPRQGGQEQAGAALQGRSSSTSCMARASPRPASWSISASRPASSRSRAPGSPTTAQRLGQGRENAKQFLQRQSGARRRDRDGAPAECRPDRRALPGKQRRRRYRGRRGRRCSFAAPMRSNDETAGRSAGGFAVWRAAHRACSSWRARIAAGDSGQRPARRLQGRVHFRTHFWRGGMFLRKRHSA